jgi:uncharacterized membrane protein YfhO
MKPSQIRKNRPKNYTLLAFLLPPAVMLAIYFITSITPFGSHTMLYSDNYHQYYPFFRQFRESLRAGDSLLWTWSVGMGMDYLGLISYYLASPLNLLSVLIPEQWVLTYFTLLMPIKLGLASGFFALMLKKVFGKNDPMLPLFGGLYAMCAWALGYQWNIMWLDTFALLPLLVLGTILLLREGKYLLYTLTLALSVAANYYIGFFVCIFVFLLFWCYEICHFKGVLRLLGDLFSIGFFTVIALGLTAVLTLPTLAALQDTYSSVNQFPSGFNLNIVYGEAEDTAKEMWLTYKYAKDAGEADFRLWLDAVIASFPPLFAAMRQVAGQIGGGQTPTYIDGLPNLYCGVFPIALGWLFLMSRHVKLRDKLCSIFLLLLFMCSFIFRQLDYIWHGFHFTNQIPYRFSFLFSFVVLYMAYRAWLLRNTFSLRSILIAGGLSVVVLLVGDHSRTDTLYWLFNLAFLGLYLLCMIASHSRYDLLCSALRAPSPEDASPTEAHLVHQATVLHRRKWVSKALAVTLTVELVLHTALFFSGFAIYDYDYPKKEGAAMAVFDKIPTVDDGKDLFYRTEVTHAQTLNDGALNGYYGISTFTSSANVATTEFMQCLGAAGYDSWNRYCYEEGSPVSNLFLNLKYLVERDGSRPGNAYFQPKLDENGLTLLENNAYLPLGFLAENKLAELEFATGKRSFSFQNTLFRTATGVLTPVWQNVAGKDVTVTADGDIQIKQNNVSGFSSFSSGAQSGTLFYTYRITQEGFMCLDINLGKHKEFTVWHNGSYLYSESYSLPQMLAVGDVKPGDTVEVRIRCTANQPNSSVSLKAAVLNEEIFRAGYEVLRASTLQLTEFSTTQVSGTIHCDRDGLLYTSIPQDGNWVAYVDGEKAEISLVGNCMVSLPLTEGDHTIDLRYENQAFRLGAWISAGSAGVLLLFTGVDLLLHRKKKA